MDLDIVSVVVEHLCGHVFTILGGEKGVGWVCLEFDRTEADNSVSLNRSNLPANGHYDQQRSSSPGRSEIDEPFGKE